ncbi:DUF1365 domain-containing protein [Burkholderia arboris]|uniref:DUF1365 domain-containing protein n=1 Tax=Burkholderia arboris TaxID=488730 RepID=UPI001CA3BA24|nr:DUF1365 domain-containing protein [Burkholderia arboris]MBY8603707.1 DUF1365 domain-containing protein [Burkholderia arboris]MCA8046118.1 DUF1365 domain-containing protein [Burkholderia arboris]
MNAPTAAGRLLVGRVTHERLRPAHHAFGYPLLQIACDIGRLDTLASGWFGIDRWRPLGLASRDYGPCDGSALEPWMRARLADAGIPAGGAIWLQTIPRVFGYAFNPVSFWYCHDRTGRLRAVYAEVRNTFGARHGYLLSGPGHAPIGAGTVLVCRKTFHVSPFCVIEGEYAFRVVRDGDRWCVAIDYLDSDGLLLRTAISMRERPLTGAHAWRAFARRPFDAVGVTLRIHWQALRLALKRVPFHGRVPPPARPSAAAGAVMGAAPDPDQTDASAPATRREARP